MAGRWLGERFNRDGQVLFDYNVYTLCGDGDMMEGISSEAASLAGHLKLDNLCWLYDNNTISIEGHTELAFSEDVIARFQAYGWHTMHVTDANDLRALSDALATFQGNTGAPTLIVVDSVIGYGSPHKHNTAAAHGEPLGAEEIRLTKAAYGWPQDSAFWCPIRRAQRCAMPCWRAAARCMSNGTSAWRSLSRTPHNWPTSCGACARGNARALAGRLARLRQRRQGRGQPRGRWRSAECLRPANPVVARRLGGPVALDQDQPYVRRRRAFQCRRLQRTQPALRYP
jgi:transketolase